MAHAAFRSQNEARRYASTSSPANRFENRAPVNSVLCRNGPQCRKFQEGTCHYNHDFGSVPANGREISKKSLSVESPAFTPKTANAQPVKPNSLSPKSVAAVAFTPLTNSSPHGRTHSKEPSGEFVPVQVAQSSQQFQEFVPGQTFVSTQQYDPQQQVTTQLNPYSDAYLAQPSNLDGAGSQLNPYLSQGGPVASQAYYQDPSSFKHPLNYHLYTSIGPKRENLAPYQRNTADFFIADDLREELQRKSEATLQTFANSTLPQAVEHLHSLVALDNNQQKTHWMFGYPSSLYKATSGKDGHTYAIRRIEGFRLNDSAAIQTLPAWKRIASASVVQIHEAFTGKWFGDSSLILVTDYFPRSQTLAEKYLNAARGGNRNSSPTISEAELWSYIVQIANGLRSIHDGGLAAQTIVPSKILITSKNRLRINGCGVLDITQYEQRRSLQELQRTDLQDLGRLILGLAVRMHITQQNVAKSLDAVSRLYSERLRACLAWLITPPSGSPESGAGMETSDDYNIIVLLNNIADKVVSALDSTLHLEDELTSDMMRELENGRLVRLVTKLNVVLERPDTGPSIVPTTNPALLNQPSAAWSETGERYTLKLFRDYVFHQVDHEGRPVLDLGHVITCLNKLDAGTDEKIQLVSRDEQSVFIVTYKEVKRGFELAWTEIAKAANAARR